MDFRDRLLRNDLRYLSDNVRTMSDELILIRDFVQHKFGAEFQQFSALNSNPVATDSKNRTFKNSGETGTGGKQMKSEVITANISSVSEESLEATKSFSTSNRRSRRKRSVKVSKRNEESESENYDSGNDLPLAMEIFEVPVRFNPNSTLGEGEDSRGECEAENGSRTSPSKVPNQYVISSKKEPDSEDSSSDDNALDYARSDSDPDFDMSEIVIIGSKSDEPHRINRKRKKHKLMSYCPVCEAEICTSQGNQALKDHIQSHTEEESDFKQVCQKCCKKRGDLESFIEHKKKCHTSRGFKNQRERCNFCDKICGDKFKRITHERVHTGERPFGCPICDKMFTTNSNMRKHASRVHT